TSHPDMPGPRKSSGSGGSRKSTSSPKKKPKMMTSGDENEMIDDRSSSESGSPLSVRRATRSSGGAEKAPLTPLEVKIVKSPLMRREEELVAEGSQSSLHARGKSPTSGKEYYHSYNMDLMYNKKVFRAPFKVHLMSWNPKMDLLAVVSEKGEVCLKRQGWKTTWKMNVNTEERVVHEFPVKNKERKGSPSCLAWSPDGMALVIGMNTGVYHIIDAEAGMLRFTWSLGAPITRMNWRSLTDKPSEGWNGPSRLEAEDGAAMAEVAESTDEKVQAAVEKALELESSMMPRSLYQTVLTVVMDGEIAVLLGGVLCVSKIDFSGFMLDTYGIAVLHIADATVDAKNDHELIVIYSGGAGTMPVRTGTSYGSWKSRRSGGRGAYEAAPSSLERHNHVMGIELAVFKMLSDRLWMLAARFVRMSITVYELTEMYDVIHKYWETESTKVVNRFAGCGFSMGEALISQILAGVSSDLMHEWVQQKMGAEGAHALREFYEKHLLELVENLRSSMLTASCALSNQMARWEDEAKLLFEEVVDPIELLLGDSSVSHSSLFASPDRNKKDESEPFRVDPSFFKATDRSAMQQLCTVLRQMVNVAEINGYEIAQLARWLSLLGPILKTSKKQVSIVRTCRKFYVPELMKYIVSTFVDAEKRPKFEELLFQLEGMAEEEEELEDEMEIISLALPSPMEGDAWYEQAKEKKPLPYDVLTRDRYFYRQAMIQKRQKYRDQQQSDLDARWDNEFLCSRYIQLGMNCPAKRSPVKADAQAQKQAAAAEAGPAANTRSHRGILTGGGGGPSGSESGGKRRESRMRQLEATPENVRNKLRVLAKSYVASKGQYPTMKKSNGNESFEIDKVSHYFRAGVKLPECVQKMLNKEDNVPSLLTLSLPDAISACVRRVAGVYESICGAAKTPITVRWCNELLSAERDVSLEEGRIDQWRFASETTRDWAEKHVKLDLNVQGMSTALCVTGWNGDGIWTRTLFSMKDETNENVREKLQWTWKIRNAKGDCILSVRPANLRFATPMSSPVRPAVPPRQVMADCTPTVEGGSAPLQPLSIQMEEDSSHSFPDHGEPIEIKQVFTMKSGTTMAVVVFENQQGKRQRLVQLNPYMDYRVFVHEDVLRSEIYEGWELSRAREMGAALSEGGTRVTWFELKEK
ncbi:hypothetical protein PENTCL1PPCAC_11819, partial [Pristionchus entomophagus]